MEIVLLLVMFFGYDFVKKMCSVWNLGWGEIRKTEYNKKDTSEKYPMIWLLRTPILIQQLLFLHAANPFIGYFLFFNDFTTGLHGSIGMPSPKSINMVLDWMQSRHVNHHYSSRMSDLSSFLYVNFMSKNRCVPYLCTGLSTLLEIMVQY